MGTHKPKPKPPDKVCTYYGKVFTPSKNDSRIRYCSENCWKTRRKDIGYMQTYYQENMNRFVENRQKPEYKEKKNAARRLRYATDEEYRNKIKAKVHDYHERKPDVRANQRLRVYGISLEDKKRYIEMQGGVCPICGNDGSNSKNNELYVDHDHKTGDVRGLLCGRCNFALGQFDDDIERMKRAILYLEGNLPDTAIYEKKNRHEDDTV